MCGGFVGRLGRKAAAVIKNPAAKLLNKNTRESSGYRNIIRPIAKVGAGAASGFVASGFNPLGAVAGGLTSAAGGGLTNNAFRPNTAILAPAAVGGALNPAVQNLLPNLGPSSPTSAANIPSSLLGPNGLAAGSSGGAAGGNILSSLTGALGLGGASGGSNILTSLINSAKANPLKALNLAGSALNAFGGTGNPLPGQVTDTQRAQAATTASGLTDPNTIRAQIANIRANPQIQTMLTDLRRQVTDEVRNEFLNTYGSALSNSGGFSSSQRGQLEQQMATELTKRLATAENQFILGQLGQELDTSLVATGQILNQPLPTRAPSTAQNIGALLASL